MPDIVDRSFITLRVQGQRTSLKIDSNSLDMYNKLFGIIFLQTTITDLSTVLLIYQFYLVVVLRPVWMHHFM